MEESLVITIDEFLRTGVLEQVPAQEKLQRARELLEMAEKMYNTTTSWRLKEILGKKIRALRNVILGLEKQLTRAVPVGSREKILRDAKAYLAQYPEPVANRTVLGNIRSYLEKLKAVAVPPTEEEREVINRLQTMYDIISQMLKQEMLKLYEEKGIAPPGEKVPRELQEAEAFRKSVEKNPPVDENSLRLRTYQAREIIGRLKLLFATLPIDKSKLWENRISSEIERLGELYRRWMKRLEHLRAIEEKKRIYAFKRSKMKYDVEKLETATSKAKAEGELKLVVEESARSLDRQMERIAQIIDIIIKKAQVEKNPEAIDLTKVKGAIDNAEMIINAVAKKVPFATSKKLHNKLRLLKQKYGQLVSIKQRLGWRR